MPGGPKGRKEVVKTDVKVTVAPTTKPKPKEKSTKKGSKPPPPKAPRKGAQSRSPADVIKALPQSQRFVSENMTHPTSLIGLFTWTGSTATASYAFNEFLSAVCQDMFRANPLLSRTDDTLQLLAPVFLKAYCQWAISHRFRKVGGLSGAYSETIPFFPDGFLLPNAVLRLMAHIGSYTKDGTNCVPQYVVESAPDWDNAALIPTATNLAKCSNVGSLLLQDFNPTIAEWVVNDTDLGTIASLYTSYCRKISQYLATTGLASPYDDSMSTEAIDGSFFAYLDYGEERASFYNDDFDPHITKIFWGGSTRKSSQYNIGFTVTKAIDTHSPALTFPALATTLSNTEWICQSYAHILDRHPNPAKQKGYTMFGCKLKYALMYTRPFNQAAFGDLLLSEFSNIDRMVTAAGGTWSQAQQICLLISCNMLLARRLWDISFPCYSNYGPSRRGPSGAILSAALPPAIVAYVNSINGIYVKSTQQWLSFSCPSGLQSYSVANDPYDPLTVLNTNNFAWTLDVDGNYFPGQITGTELTIKSAGKTLDAAWNANAILALKVYWPDYLLQDIVLAAQDIYLGVNTAQLWKKVDKVRLGNSPLLVQGEYVQQTIQLPAFGSSGLVPLYRRPISRIGSVVPLADADLVWAYVLCPYSGPSSSPLSPTPTEYPYTHMVGGYSSSPSALLEMSLRQFYTSRSAIQESKNVTSNINIGSSMVSVGSTSSWFDSSWRSMLEGVAQGWTSFTESLTPTVVRGLQNMAHTGSNYVFNAAVGAIGNQMRRTLQSGPAIRLVEL